ncbi:hypothetical protein DFH06DRAFT_1122384 [Mycena polygramma]|nr:hypothetical protein DFH06DRAFT_1122384 [Mycena polygramma]
MSFLAPAPAEKYGSGNAHVSQPKLNVQNVTFDPLLLNHAASAPRQEIRNRQKLLDSFYYPSQIFSNFPGKASYGNIDSGGNEQEGEEKKWKSRREVSRSVRSDPDGSIVQTACDLAGFCESGRCEAGLRCGLLRSQVRVAVPYYFDMKGDRSIRIKISGEKLVPTAKSNQSINARSSSEDENGNTPSPILFQVETATVQTWSKPKKQYQNTSSGSNTRSPSSGLKLNAVKTKFELHGQEPGFGAFNLTRAANPN